MENLSKIEELIAERDRLSAQIEAENKASREEALATVKRLVAHYGFSAVDMGTARAVGRPARKVSAGSNGKAAKYADPNTGKSWSGHGKRPKWFAEGIAAGHKPEDFAVHA